MEQRDLRDRKVCRVSLVPRDQLGLKGYREKADRWVQRARKVSRDNKESKVSRALQEKMVQLGLKGLLAQRVLQGRLDLGKSLLQSSLLTVVLTLGYGFFLDRMRVLLLQIFSAMSILVLIPLLL